MVSLIRALVLLTLLGATLSGCSLTYIVKNAYYQARMLKHAVPIKDILEDPKIDETTKSKLRIASEAKVFAEKTLKLKSTKNYSTFVQLDGPYVTYIVSAAPKNELKYYTWYFPIVGSVPYKGYFVKEGAEDEAKDLKDEGYDVYVRGVTAFSTLGWFKDPVLSSMMSYAEYDLVNTIIHETVHATLYISSNANFNERLASYLGDLGTRMFYIQKHAPQTLLDEIQNDSADEKLFGEYISGKLKNLEKWYTDHKNDPHLLELREKEFQAIRDDFKKDVIPKMKTQKYNRFAEAELNNAKLLGYKLYMNNLEEFDKLTKIFSGNFDEILKYCKSLENEKDPEKALKAYVQTH
jgi:predicted aminopeptidase